MNTYSSDELKLIIQTFVPLLFVGVLATTLIIVNDGYPWYMMLGTALGISIIMISWTGKKYAVSLTSLLVCAVIYSALAPLYA